MTACSRCQGLLVTDVMYDDHGPMHKVPIIKCANCGHVQFATPGVPKRPSVENRRPARHVVKRQG